MAQLFSSMTNAVFERNSSIVQCNDKMLFRANGEKETFKITVKKKKSQQRKKKS